MIFLDTSVLIASFTGEQTHLAAYRAVAERHERMAISSLVLHEWLRGPRFAEELRLQEAIFPSRAIVSFGAEEASIAADIYRAVARPRGREVDIMIAACALRHKGELWTLNPADFRDIPRLKLLPTR